jgi:hypothetical protein
MDMKLKSMIDSKQLNQIKLFGLFAVYPTLFMSPALFSGNTLMVRKTNSDVGHYVWVAQQLNAMQFPWSRNMLIAAPKGVTFWNPAAIVNGAYWLLLWVLTRVFSPLVSVNLTLLSGWVLSGVCAYVLAKKLGANHVGSIVAGISLQMLPWFREKLIAHPLYIFWCVPLVVLILLVDFLKEVSFKNLVRLAFFLIFAFFIDLYWFWYSIDIVVIVLIANAIYLIKKTSRWSQWQRILSGLAAISFPASVYMAYGVLQKRTSTDVTWERPLEIASSKFIDQFQSSLWRSLTPPPEHLLFSNHKLLNVSREDVVNYVGISVFLLAVCSFITVPRLKRGRELVSLLVIAVVFSLFTVPTSFELFGLNLGGLVDALRVLNPGLRIFSRTGMVAQAALCVLAGVGVSKLAVRVRHKRIFGTLLILALILDLNPFARRLSNDDYKEFTEIRESIAQVDSPVTLELWPELDRLYFPRYYMNSAKSFTWEEHNDRSKDVLLHASRGDEDFYQYLKSRGITHVLISRNIGEESAYLSKWGRYGSIHLKFDEKYFKVLATSKGDVPAFLLELRQGIPAETCVQCNPYNVIWSGVHFGFAGILWDGVQFQGTYVDGVNLSWVLSGENPSFQISSEDGTSRSYEVAISMVPAFGPQARPQVVGVTTKTGTSTHQLSAGKVTEVALVVKAGDSVVLKSYLPCVVPSAIDPGNTDQRELCYGVTDFTVKEIFP